MANETVGAGYPDKLRQETLAKFSSVVVDLQEELDEILRVLKFQRETLTNSMMEGMGYKQMKLDANHAKLATVLASSYQKAVDAKVKLDKHLRDKAENLTLEEEIASVEAYIKAMDSTVRRRVLIGLLNFHNLNTDNTTWLIKSE